MRRRRYQPQAPAASSYSDAELLSQYQSLLEMPRTPERRPGGQPLRGDRRHLELLRQRKAQLLDEIQRRGLSLPSARSAEEANESR